LSVFFFLELALLEGAAIFAALFLGAAFRLRAFLNLVCFFFFFVLMAMAGVYH
jgi:hypothetical protein